LIVSSYTSARRIREVRLFICAERSNIMQRIRIFFNSYPAFARSFFPLPIFFSIFLFFLQYAFKMRKENLSCEDPPDCPVSSSPTFFSSCFFLALPIPVRRGCLRIPIPFFAVPHLSSPSFYPFLFPFFSATCPKVCDFVRRSVLPPFSDTADFRVQSVASFKKAFYPSPLSDAFFSGLRD